MSDRGAMVYPRQVFGPAGGPVAELVVVIDGRQAAVVPLSGDEVDLWIWKLAGARCLGRQPAACDIQGGD